MSQYRPKLQSINLGQIGDVVAASGNGLTGPMGTVSDTVIRFTAANTVTTGRGVTVTDSVTLGTIVTLTNPGLYLCVLAVNTTEQAGATTALMAITRDSTILDANPTFAGGALVLGTSTIQLTAGVQEFSNRLLAYARVTNGETALIRFQASDGADAAPTNLNTTIASFSIRRVTSLG
jgi:hypothetical protein